jgi:hypothetical protein
MERGTFVQIGLCIAAHFRDSLGAVIGVALIAVSIGTSCMANDLQHCCPEDRSGRFVPLVSKIADGGQINTEPFYESYRNQSPVGLIGQKVGKLDSTTLF